MYTKPGSSPATKDTKIVESSREKAMAAAPLELGKRSFSIDTIDTAAGLINVTYSGDPEKYVDCGRLDASVRDSGGKRRYGFALAKAKETYEARIKNHATVVDRSMHLATRATLIFEEISAGRTKVTIIARYILVQQQSTTASVSGAKPQAVTKTFQFNSASGGQAAQDADQTTQSELPASLPWHSHDPTLCIPTGQLESDILSAVQ
jgi:hypothetical protein